MRNAFISEITRLAGDEKVIVLLADNGIIVFDEYRRKFPRQVVNLGIAESNMIAMSAGMANCGLKPFVYTIIPFLTMRPYEFIKNDICYQKRNVKLIGTGAGFAYSTLGPTHHAIEDLAIMRALPHMIVVSPADPRETRKATKALYETESPAYMRIGTGNNPSVYPGDYEFVVGKGVVLKEGRDVAIIGTGTILAEVLKAAESLKAEGISAKVVNIHTLKPLDEELILGISRDMDAVVTVEEHLITGGLGSSVAELLAEKGERKNHFLRIGLRDSFCQGYGNIDEVRQANGLDRCQIAGEIRKFMGRCRKRKIIDFSQWRAEKRL